MLLKLVVSLNPPTSTDVIYDAFNFVYSILTGAGSNVVKL